MASCRQTRSGHDDQSDHLSRCRDTDLRHAKTSSRFWARFAKQHLEKRPLNLKRPFVAPITTAAELFRAMVAARAKLGQNEKRHLRFFVDDEIRRSHIRQNLPRGTDANFDGYCKRISRSLNGARFGLVVVEYPSFDARIQKRVRQFLRPLQELISSGVKPKTLLFMGNYERTPVGIHRDLHGTFVFVIEGRKRFRAWPGSFFPDAGKITGRLRYRQFLAGSITLEGTAGDLIYWPSSYWHIGEPVGGFSISLNVGVFGQPKSTKKSCC
jgi:50S ribosomal protein L16 3-hydroxylase